MNILIIYAHPKPESFNAAICDAVEKEFTSKDFQVRKRDIHPFIRIKFRLIFRRNRVKLYGQIFLSLFFQHGGLGCRLF
jgi:hypothetical protein